MVYQPFHIIIIILTPKELKATLFCHKTGKTNNLFWNLISKKNYKIIFFPIYLLSFLIHFYFCLWWHPPLSAPRGNCPLAPPSTATETASSAHHPNNRNAPMTWTERKSSCVQYTTELNWSEAKRAETELTAWGGLVVRLKPPEANEF